MSVDAETVRWALTGLLGLIMWFGKQTLDDIKHEIVLLKEEDQSFKQNYIHKDNFKEFKEELRAMFAEMKSDIKEIARNGS